MAHGVPRDPTYNNSGRGFRIARAMLLPRCSFLHTIGSEIDIYATGHAIADGRFRLGADLFGRIGYVGTVDRGFSQWALPAT